MPSYDVCYGTDVPAYGSQLIEAEGVEQVVAEAKRLWNDDLLNITLKPEWDLADNWRIVDICNAALDELVAEAIDLTPPDRLREAAPDLLEACKTLLEYFDISEVWDAARRQAGLDGLDTAKRAIAKAEDQQP